MYKSKLQELCHKRKWCLPTYSTTKIGVSNMARFMASVVINGETYNSPSPFISSKEAQNEAAKLAFLKFSSIPSGSSNSTPTTAKDHSKEEDEAVKPEENPIPANSPVVIVDTNQLCKDQLQNHTQKNNLDLPIYMVKTEGPAHAIRFKATVVVDGKTFESPTFFNTKKEAEHAAAKIALMSLPIDMIQKDESTSYKSLLLELTQKQGFFNPTYKTTQSDLSHMPTFFSTVEVKGEEFHGKASSSKKLAEQDAAKIAYIALKECGLEMYGAVSSSLKKQKVVHSTKQNLNPEGELKDMEINDVKVNNEENSVMCKGSSSSSSSKSFPLSEFDLSCLPTSKSKKEKSQKTLKTSSYMQGNGFKVYTSFPNIVFSEEITLLPIGDNKWLAVNMEFPSGKDL